MWKGHIKFGIHKMPLKCELSLTSQKENNKTLGKFEVVSIDTSNYIFLCSLDVFNLAARLLPFI